MKSSRASMERTKEFKKALRRSSKYFLSHHDEGQLDRCYSLKLGPRNIDLCSRCLGIYPGFIAGYFVFSYFRPLSALEIFFSGLPTVAEKYFSSVTNRISSNYLRTFTGLILGLGFMNGILELLENPLKMELLAISAFYLAVTVILLELESKHR